MKYGFVFAGQGSQYPKMGYDFYNRYDYVKKLYEEATNVLGFSIEEICFTENEKLNQTKYLQPATLITSIAIYEVVKKEYNLSPSVVAGFSLGEYTALYASGIFSFKQVVELVKLRAMFMDEATKDSDGKMAAIIGLKINQLEEIINKFDDVFIANFNSPVQYVISGTQDGVEKASQEAKLKGAKRVINLNVSGAFHSRFMASASGKLYEVLNETSYKKPKIDLIANINAEKIDINNLAMALKKQVESPVLWIDTINKIIADYKPDYFIEIGPGKVLSGLIRKIDRNQKIININKTSDLDLLREES